jgi:hypothetical protein
MDDFNTALIREKIIFIDSAAPQKTDAMAEGHHVVRSNRLLLNLPGDKGVERLVIRSQTMPGTLRLAAAALMDFCAKGKFSGRGPDWDELWERVRPPYDKKYNPDNWAAVYVDGRNVFKTNASSYADVIEQCAQVATGNYDDAIAVTEGALRRIGKNMQISHSSTVAAVFTNEDDSLRTAIVNRRAGKTNAFNFVANGGDVDRRAQQVLFVTASMLESLNLRLTFDALNVKMRSHRASRDEQQQFASLLGRMDTLYRHIESFENEFNAKYRPEKPAFFKPEKQGA